MQSKGKRELGKIMIIIDLSSQITDYMRSYFRVCLLLFIGFLLVLPSGCSTEVDINAEPKDVWSIYGTLNPKDTIQDIRISMGFLPETNAEEVAKSIDLSLKGLLVTLSDGNKEWVATQVDEVEKEPGDFFPTTTIYRFLTQGADVLEPGVRYTLTATKPDDEDFFLTSATTIPEEIEFSSPSITPGPGGQRCLRQINLEDEYKVVFNDGGALGFELRAYLDYTENGIEKQAQYGPTNLFTQDFRCLSTGAMCYQFRANEITLDFFQDMNIQPGSVYEYPVTEATRCNDVPANLPNAFRFEVTAVDSAIATYNFANDPAFTDFNTVRDEYTNIEGNGITIGIFGSVNTGTASGQLSPCTLFLLELNETASPISVCEF